MVCVSVWMIAGKKDRWEGGGGKERREIRDRHRVRESYGGLGSG